MEDFNYGQLKLDQLAVKLGLDPKERRPAPEIVIGENRAERREREKRERRNKQLDNSNR